MNKNLQILSINDFKEKNIDSIGNFYDNLYKIALNAYKIKNLASLKDSVISLSYSFERIRNILTLTEEKNALCYYFGCINSLVDFILDNADSEEVDEVLKGASKNYPLLIPALKIISDHVIISGIDLQKELKLKASSNLSNFINRIKKFDLICIKKIGTTNFYSLTQRGKRLLEVYNINCPSNEANEIYRNNVAVDDIFSLLTGISKEIKENSPNSLRLMNNYVKFKTERSERIVLKEKLEEIFYARDSYIRLRFKLESPPKSYYSYELCEDSTAYFQEYSTKLLE